MKQASDYPVTFPYGETSDPYSTNHTHRGDDRACPSGTPIIINGVTIGLTGATGMVTGPHLHIQEWNGSYTNTRKPQNSFNGGTVVNIDTSGVQGDGTFGKFVTVQTADGWNDSYCHLSEIYVKVGQVIGGNNMTDKVTFEQLQQMSQAVLGRKTPVTKEWYDGNPPERSMTTDQVLNSWIPSQEAQDFRYKSWDYDRLAKEFSDYKNNYPISDEKCTQDERAYLDALKKIT